MTEIGIFGIAYDDRFHRHNAYGIFPQFRNYVEVSPRSAMEYEENGNFVKVETTAAGCKVTAADEVVLPDGEERKFSFWLVDSDGNGTVEQCKQKTLHVHKGQFGWVGLYFGVPAIPTIHKYEPRLLAMEEFVDRVIAGQRQTKAGVAEEEEFELAHR